MQALYLLYSAVVVFIVDAFLLLQLGIAVLWFAYSFGSLCGGVGAQVFGQLALVLAALLLLERYSHLRRHCWTKMAKDIVSIHAARGILICFLVVLVHV